MSNLILKLVRKIKHKYKKHKTFQRARKEIFPEGNITVLHGSFKGMKYPNFKSAGSSLWPKLLGTYECELNDIIGKCLGIDFEYIIDVGCAEGYYAVGFGMKGKYKTIIGYDVDMRAQNLIKKMSRANDVEIVIKDWCSGNDIEQLDAEDGYNLIIVDCEGYERKLLSDVNENKLKRDYLLIEIHDWCQDESRTKNIIIDKFSKTHKHIVIDGKDDYDKAYDYHVDEIVQYPIDQRFELLCEERKRLGQWLFFVPNECSNLWSL